LSIIGLIKEKYKIVSIVGMAKNAGKTSALNYLIQQSEENGVTLGLTSTGRDGEREDVVTNTEKPPIFALEGTLLATSTETLALGDAKIEILKATEHRTPMGQVVIGRVIERGYIQLAGPQTNTGIKDVCQRMIDLGADIAFIDGAINRMASASPFISQGVILSTGAVLSRDMNKVIEETLHTINLLSLSTIDNKVDRGTIEEVVEEGKIATIDRENRIKYIDIKTAINSGSIIGGEINEDTKYVVFPGSLVKRTLEDIIKSTTQYKNVTFLVTDGTKVFIEPKDWMILMSKGLNIKVLNPIYTIAVTINPYAPQGYYFGQKEFLDRMRNYLKDVPVFDVMVDGD